MKTFFGLKTVSSLALFLVLCQGTISYAKEINKTFTGVSDIKIKLVNGDCIVEKSSDNAVKVSVTYSYDDSDFEAEFNQTGAKLYVAENFFGGNNHGASVWKIHLPSNVDVDFSAASGSLELAHVSGDVEGQTASGDMTVSEVSGDVQLQAASGDISASDVGGDVKISTASGDITLSGISKETRVSAASGGIKIKDAGGELEVSAASGDIKIDSAKGTFEVSTASGNISCAAVEITADSRFEAASGDVEVSLAKSPAGDLVLSAASGDCELDYGSNVISGYITMTARNRAGYVKAPFKFDNEKVHEKWGNEFVTKTARRGDGPAIELNSSSGSVTVVQK